MFIFPVFIASLITFFTIMFLRPFAIRINLTDKPGDRKLHVDSVPLVGGIAMYFGITISLLILPIDLNDLEDEDKIREYENEHGDLVFECFVDEI